MTLSPVEFRKALGHFITGVTVVTTRCALGTPQGITANSFTSVSLDPPLISVNLSRTLASFEHYLNCDAFAVHVLGADQRPMSARFASRGSDKWQGLDRMENRHGVPVLSGCLGLFECTRHSTFEAGDHVILIGQVQHFEVKDGAEPLAFFNGDYRAIADRRLTV